MAVETCIYCFKDDEDLIVPCQCKRVHRACLESWRLKSDTADAFFRCEICNDKYRLKPSIGVYVYTILLSFGSLLFMVGLSIVVGDAMRLADATFNGGMHTFYPEYARSNYTWIIVGFITWTGWMALPLFVLWLIIMRLMFKGDRTEFDFVLEFVCYVFMCSFSTCFTMVLVREKLVNMVREASKRTKREAMDLRSQFPRL